MSITKNIDGHDIEIKYWSKNDRNGKNVYDIRSGNNYGAKESLETLLKQLKGIGAEVLDQRTFLSQGSGRSFYNDGELLKITRDADEHWTARFNSQLSLDQLKEALKAKETQTQKLEPKKSTRDSAIDQAIEEAQLSNQKKQEVRSALNDTISWMESGAGAKDDNGPTAQHKAAAEYAIQNPTILVTVARGLAEGEKPLDYASKAIVQEHIKALAKPVVPQKAARPLYRLELDISKRELLGHSPRGFLLDLLSAARTDTMPALREKLRKNGYDFGKEEFFYQAAFLFPNIICHSGSETIPPLARIDYILEVLDEVGQRPTLSDWKTRFGIDGDRHNIVTYAAKIGVLDKLFKPSLWANHIDEMEKVWDLVPSRSRNQVNFIALRSEAEALSLPEFEVTGSLSKAALFVPNENGGVPFDDIRTWRKFDAIVAALEVNGDALSKVDLLQKGSKGRPYLQIAVAAGVFNKVAEYLAGRGEKLTLEEVKQQGIESQYTTPKEKLSLIDRDNPDVLVQLPGTDSLLQLAVLDNDLELTKRIVANLKEIHKGKPQELLTALISVGSNDYSPASTARRANNKELEQYLLQEISDVTVSMGKPSDFVQAASDGNLALVQKYIEQKTVDLEATHFDNKWTALISAINNNHEPVVDALLAAGANPDARSRPEQNISPLFLSTQENNQKIAAKIIAALKDKYKDDPVSLFKALTFQNSGTRRSAYEAAKNNSYNGIARLIDAEVAALIPTIANWDETTLNDTDAHRVFKEHGRTRDLAATLDNRPHKRIAIVGAGFSGALTAIHLLNNTREPLEVMLIEKRKKETDSGRAKAPVYGGVAYSAETTSEELLTNIPISRMSAFDDKPNDLLDWLKTVNRSEWRNPYDAHLNEEDRQKWPEKYIKTTFEPNSSVPRVIYGMYLITRLAEAESRNENALFKRVSAEVVDVIDQSESESDVFNPNAKATIVFKDGTAYEANQAILATGYTTPKEAKFTAKIKETGRYIADPYSSEGQEQKKAIAKDETVLVVGSGLSAYDAILSLKEQGHEGKIILCSRGGYTHQTYPNAGIEQSFSIDRPRFMDATTVPELISGIRKDFWERTAVEGHTSERVIEAYQRYVPELIKKFPQDAVRQLLRDHSSLIATSRVGVGAGISRIVENAKISGQVEIIAANLHEMLPTETGLKVRYTPSGSSHEETMEIGHVISCLGRDTGKDDLWRNLTARGQTQAHFTGHGIQVGTKGQMIDSLDNESSTVIAVGPMRVGDNIERLGYIGPQTQNVPGMRRQMLDAAELALERISKQSVVSHIPVHATLESVADKVVIRDKNGRMHCEISFDADSQPNEMKVFVGRGQGTLTEVHTRGDNDGVIKVTRYLDGEAQSPVIKRFGDAGFISWNDVLASQQHAVKGREAIAK